MNARVLTLKKIVLPNGLGPTAMIGGAAGLIGDFSNFLSDSITPGLLLGAFVAALLVFGMLCIQRALLVTANGGPSLEEVAHCALCDGMRIALAGTAVFLLLTIVGQGESATEVIGAKLGLIHEEVQKIGHDVGDIHDVVQPQMIIDHPTSPAERFNNAYVYMIMRRDPVHAWEAVQAVYVNGAPRKLDAAELYFNAGRQFLSRDTLLSQMANLGRQQKDATLLVIAGRNTLDDKASDDLYAEAREIDPDLPLAWWDVQRHALRIGRFEGSIDAQRKALIAQREAMQTFLSKLDATPPSRYYFVPQYQPDYAVSVRQLLNSTAQTVNIYSRFGRVRRH